MNKELEKKVYNPSEIQKILGMGRNKVYSFLDEVYKTQSPFRVLKLGKLYKVPKADFDKWINGYQ